MAQTARVILGDCRDVLKNLEAESFDSLVTDPPAGISFLGKAWDSYESLAHFQEDLTLIFCEALRVLKPGAHGLVWALPRTSNFTANALGDAGFEIRDTVLHLFGQGMPKGQNVAKAGAGPAWEGWNIALKPAHEVWWLVRKPLHEGTVVKQVLETGTGALNIDACRVPTTENTKRPGKGLGSYHDDGRRLRGNYDPQRITTGGHSGGRWPANVMLSHAAECEDVKCADGCAVQALDEQSGILGVSGSAKRVPTSRPGPSTFSAGNNNPDGYIAPNDEGGASRFFYTSKVAPNERKLGDGTMNQHPTAKSIKLMRYLVRLVTPPGGTVVDSFAGSGTTGVAALREGFSFVGVEQDPEHHRVADLRVSSALRDREDQEWMLTEDP